MKRYSIIAIIFSLLCIFVSCGHPSVPTGAKQEGRVPKIHPDYVDVTIPCNIAPLNFAVDEGADEVVARLTYPGGEQTYGDGTKVLIDEGKWKDILAAAKGKSIKVEVFAKVGGEWKAYKAFSIDVAEEEIDPYISYRLIQPSYVAYEMLSISQRNITTFEETEIYNNMSINTDAEGQCINCHSYRNYKTDYMLFHMRQAHGGTMLVNGDELRKVNLKVDQTISAGVYPAWHPTENVIAFSTNKTGQSFHTKDIAKIEVQDSYSDLILYDVDRNKVSIISNDANELEVFPTWSADGKKLYFCSAHFVLQMTDSVEPSTEMIKRYDEVKYDLYSLDFDTKTHTFSNLDTLYKASAVDASVSLPRVSPDGRYIVFAQAKFGCFHVWHHDADLKMMDLKTRKFVDISKMNSPRSESYPTWSSNGRWIMTASRRDDGCYTRPYIAYFDKQGKVHKAFEVPQRDPDHYTLFLRSYNRPEFMVEPVKISPQTFTEKAKEEAVQAEFEGEADGVTGATSKQ